MSICYLYSYIKYTLHALKNFRVGRISGSQSGTRILACLSVHTDRWHPDRVKIASVDWLALIFIFDFHFGHTKQTQYTNALQAVHGFAAFCFHINAQADLRNLWSIKVYVICLATSVAAKCLISLFYSSTQAAKPGGLLSPNWAITDSLGGQGWHECECVTGFAGGWIQKVWKIFWSEDVMASGKCL